MQFAIRNSQFQIMTDLTIEVQGESVQLLPERALFWLRTKTLFIADPHFGKVATFQSHGVPLPAGSDSSTLQRLSQALERSKAEKLIILGDLFHTARGRSDEVIKALTAWRKQHADLPIYLVRGNHDRHAGDPPAEWNVQGVEGPTPGPLWVLNHEPIQPAVGYALAGHLHPAIMLFGRGQQSLKLPCFWFGAKCGVLPAFGEFIDHGLIQPQKGDQLFAVGEGKVFALR